MSIKVENLVNKLKDFTIVLKPTKFKKVAYLSASTLLGLILSINAHAFLEINYINSVIKQGQVIRFYGGCALPPAIQITIILIGLIFGFLFGHYWWQKIYIERIFEKRKSFYK